MFHDVWDSWPSVEKVSPCVQWHWAEHNTFKMFSKKDDNSSRWIADKLRLSLLCTDKMFMTLENTAVLIITLFDIDRRLLLWRSVLGYRIGGIGTRIILNHSLNWHPWTINFGSSFSCVIIQIAADIHSSILHLI